MTYSRVQLKTLLLLAGGQEPKRSETVYAPTLVTLLLAVIIKKQRIEMTFRGRVFRVLQQLLAFLRASMAVGVRASDLRSALKLIQPKPSPAKLVRIGGNGDGGYLVPDDLEGLVACFSPGVAESANFEIALAEKGIRSFMADYSVESAPVGNNLFDFEKLYLATHGEPGMFIRLDEWIAVKKQEKGDLVLQMDIEGNEWPILADISPETLSRFRIIVLELHGMDNLLTNPLGIEIFTSVFRKLNHQFSVIHLHANNCCGALKYQGVEIPRVLEVTLIRNDRYENSKQVFESTIPNALDVPNVPGRKELTLSRDWLG